MSNGCDVEFHHFINKIHTNSRSQYINNRSDSNLSAQSPADQKNTSFNKKSNNPNRKTKYDLITVKKGDRLINMDSQAPNTAAKEWLLSGGLGEISDLKAEYTHGDSRFDFSFLMEGKRCFLEVKGVTLEDDGVCAFPDAPTERGVKHLKGLTQAAKDGYGAFVLFVIQMADVKYLRPHDERDPAFGAALREAAENGVTVMAMDCGVTEDTMQIRLPVLVRL